MIDPDGGGAIKDEEEIGTEEEIGGDVGSGDQEQEIRNQGGGDQGYE